MKIRSISILIILIVIFSNVALSYTQLNERQTNVLIPSEKRFVYSLAGAWERSQDGKNWESIKLPATEETEDEIVYKRLLKISREMREGFAWQLYFLGIDHQVEVYINDQFIGRYFGNLTPFEVRIPKRMITSESNMLKLVFSPPSGASRQIKTQQLFAKEMYSGLIREVFLVGTPNVWIDKINYIQEFNSSLTSCKLKGEFSISSGKINDLYRQKPDSLRSSNEESINLNVVIELINPSTGEIISTANSNNIKIDDERTIDNNFEIAINNPTLWSPENPKLYTLTAKIYTDNILLDDYRKNIGFRSIKSGNEGLYLNNQKFKLKGVSYIEDYYKDIASISPKRFEEDINLIKTLGANTIRFKYSSPHPYMAELCNKYGLFMMIELPVYDVPADLLALDEIKVNMKNIAKQFILSYNTDPAALAYGIASGTKEGANDFNAFSKELQKVFRTGTDKLLYKVVPFGSSEINTDGYDLVGFKDVRKNTDFNYVNAEISRLKSLCEDVPSFFTYGTIIHPENNNGYSDPLSVEFQAYNILNSYNISKDNELAGSLVNTFNDYRLENPILLADNPNVYLGAFGLFDRERNQRLSYKTLQTLYNDENEPLLNAGSFNESTPYSYIVVGLILLIVLILLLNRFKRFREYFFRSILRPYNFYADIRDQRIMSSVQTFIMSVVISATLAIYSSSIFYFYKTNELAQYVMMMLVKWNSVQEALYRIIWMPEVTTLILTVVFFLGIFFLSLLIRLFAVFMRARIFMNDAFTIAVWSALPMMFLLPVSIFLLRILVVAESSIIVFLLLFLITQLWSLSRLLKASAVVFDKPSGRVYALGIFVFIIIAGIPLVYYQIKFSLLLYTQYFIDVLVKM